MKVIRLAALVLPVVLAGCMHNYQYMARGKLTYAGATPKGAVLYWHKDEGRLWYGRRIDQVDSGLTLRICQQPGKAFRLENSRLILDAKGGDRLVAAVSGDGAVSRIPAPRPAGIDGVCGLILLDGVPTLTSNMHTGTRPEVAILCDNVARPDRYPEARAYAFGAISREPTPRDRSAPDPCESR